MAARFYGLRAAGRMVMEATAAELVHIIPSLSFEK
jgi:hypothetical protein